MLERITNAALVYQGKRFEGASHTLALFELFAEFGEVSDDAFEHIAQGFVTSAGRFVSRAEATTIARLADQVQSDEQGELQSEHILH